MSIFVTNIVSCQSWEIFQFIILGAAEPGHSQTIRPYIIFSPGQLTITLPYTQVVDVYHDIERESHLYMVFVL